MIAWATPARSAEAVGERADRLLGDLVEVRQIEDSAHPLLDRVAGHAAALAGEHQVVVDAHVRVDRWVLRQEPGSSCGPRADRRRRPRPRPRSTPADGRRSQARMRRAVVLPAPLRPRKPTVSPSEISNETGPRSSFATVELGQVLCSDHAPCFLPRVPRGAESLAFVKRDRAPCQACAPKQAARLRSSRWEQNLSRSVAGPARGAALPLKVPGGGLSAFGISAAAERRGAPLFEGL